MNGDTWIRGEVVGIVTQLELSGFGPNSGEFTLGITALDGTFTQLFGGVMGDTHNPNGLEPELFAAIVHMASYAFLQRPRVKATYWIKDKKRISYLTFVQ